MLFTDFMKLYRNKIFDKIAISVGTENYVHYYNYNIEGIMNKYGQHIVTNIDYDPNTPSVLYVDLISGCNNYFSLRHIRHIIEPNTRIIVKNMDGRIIDDFNNRDSIRSFYDAAVVLEHWFLNNGFYVKVNV